MPDVYANLCRTTKMTKPRVLGQAFLWALAASAMQWLSGCASLQPQPLATGDLRPAIGADREVARAGVEPLASPLTLPEALARALKYNLDRRAKMMEEALALNQFEAGKYDMLPRLLASAGYQTRNNDRISESRSAADGSLSPSRFISQERSHELLGLDLSWSVLDVGLGYYGARQQADRVLIASERRRKAMHLLMQDVRTAYWRAASAQKLRGDVERTLAMAEEALADARKAEQERVRNPLDTLRYQRQLLENMRLLESIDQELSAAQLELAALVNAPLDRPLRIADAQPEIRDDGLAALDVQRLEDIALENNADLREQHYNGRIAREEVRRTLVRLFPNVSFNYGVKYDSDSYLVNRQWNEAGLQLSFNLFNLLTGPSQVKLAQAGVALADQRRIALQMTVVTQVHLARLQVLNARSQFARADAIYVADVRIADHMRNRETALAQSKLDRVGNETAAILSLLRRYQALAQVQACESRLAANLGMEPRIGNTDELTLAALTEQIGGAGANWLQVAAPQPAVVKP
ncbi:TolC family protein [Roseateles sp. BYS96W]|uniref:TolC family protein n=1 Tax=Pelomonas nitida TaxID=3299027 RepID=A0ABW7G1I3_9BURK